MGMVLEVVFVVVVVVVVRGNVGRRLGVPVSGVGRVQVERPEHCGRFVVRITVNSSSSSDWRRWKRFTVMVATEKVRRGLSAGVVYW